MRASVTLSSGFQSTPSARRATGSQPDALTVQTDFNPRPPRGERPLRGSAKKPLYLISIHALREESDGPLGRYIAPAIVFQSTPSARRATDFALYDLDFLVISIHALREESDEIETDEYAAKFQFQSTPSARRATQKGGGTACQPQHFNPRPPRGERPNAVCST